MVGFLNFEPGIDSQTISVRIFGDDEFEDNEDFYVDMYSPEPPTVTFQVSTVRS